MSENASTPSIIDPNKPTTLVNPAQHMFRISQQPFDKQRKSYKNENRYLLPNPMIICPVQTVGLPKVNGEVSAKLYFENRSDTGRNVLHGALVKELDAEKRANFILKCLDTSDGQYFRIVFTVKYIKTGDPTGTVFEEVIESHPFVVTSNKKKQLVDRPIIIDLKPGFGASEIETEVWIKGCQFTDKAGMIVRFGGREARVLETEENIITCFAPARPDLIHETKVIVEVSNFHPSEGAISGDRNLEFIYLGR